LTFQQHRRTTQPIELVSHFVIQSVGQLGNQLIKESVSLLAALSDSLAQITGFSIALLANLH